MLEVLQNRTQYDEARELLKRLGRSALTPWPRRLLASAGIGLAVGDHIKSWDVARTLDLIEQHVPKDAPVLDLGAFCSELPVALAQMGYRDVHGIDLNPRVARMPLADQVRYAVGDFTATPYPEASFQAITAISVIEHGYQPHRLFAEVGRLLRTGGLFIASFDYWPDKIDTGSTTFFGLSWLIFSKEDYQAMLDAAAHHGLHAIEGPDAAASARPVSCAGFDYTFALTALRKA
jgi:SAM-dependent methyltransferase